VAGGILVFLWAFTDHAVAYRNENLFQASLLPLPLLVLLPALVRGGAWARRPAVTFAALVAASSLLGAGLKVFPGLSQDNLQILALALPANLGLAAGALALARRLRA
jgi:cytochrome bd-type quinol oxidase subunit 2